MPFYCFNCDNYYMTRYEGQFECPKCGSDSNMRYVELLDYERVEKLLTKIRHILLTNYFMTLRRGWKAE